MSVIIEDFRSVFDSLLNPQTITGAKTISESIQYEHIINDIVVEREYIRKLHDYILSHDFLQYQEEKLKLLLGIFIFRNPFQEKGKPFYLLGNQDAFLQGTEKPSFLLQPHYYNLTDKGELKYKVEPKEFINHFLKINLEDRKRKDAKEQDFFVYSEDEKKLSAFEREYELYYIPSGEFDFCILQWLFLHIKKNKKNKKITLNGKYDIIGILSADAEYKDIDFRYFFRETTVLTLEEWLEQFGLISRGVQTERGIAVCSWAKQLMEPNDKESEHHFKANPDLKSLYTVSKPIEESIVGLVEVLNSLNTSYLNNGFIQSCRFRLPIHFIMRYAKRNATIENTCRGLFALNAFKQKANDSEKYENVGFFLALFKDSTSDGKNYTLLSNDVNIKSEFISLINNYKLLVRILGEIEFRETYQKNVLLKHIQDITNEALKSAIAAVCSRNLSHAIGSHVLPEYRNYYTSLFNKKIDGKDSGENLKAYFDYTQNRMEFIADITISQDKRVPFSFSLKEINNDFRKYLKNIGLGLFDAFNNKDAVKTSITLLPNNKPEEKNVFIPGGQLGVSAYYLIIENILRNYYKHSRPVRNGEFVFKMDISDPEHQELKGDYWCVDIFDIHGSENPQRNILHEANSYKLLYDIQKHIDSPIIINGRLRTGGWGFIEMKAAAAYLINFPTQFIDSGTTAEVTEIYPLKLLEVAFYEIDENKNIKSRTLIPGKGKSQLNLGFRFYVKKAKSLLIDKNYLLAEVNLDDFRNKGIDVHPLSKEDFVRSEHELLLTPIKLTNTNQRTVAYPISETDSITDIIDKSWSKYVNNINKKPTNIFFNPYDDSLIKEGKINIAIGSHGGENMQGATFNQIKKKKLDAYFVQSSEFPTFPKEIVVLGTYSEECKNHARVKEVALITVSVFDERIQKDVIISSANQPNLTYRDLHELSGIFIPLKQKINGINSSIQSIDLDKISNQKSKSSFHSIIIDRLRSDNYVIIHYTLFEKIVPNGVSILDFYEKQFNANERRKMVFCSGRGRPSNLIDGCYYVNLSTLQDVLIKKPSKFSLVNILKSL